MRYQKVHFTIFEERTYAASGATPEFPDFCSVSLQSRTFLIKLQVLSISLSKEVNFIREKSSLQAGIGARVVPCPAGFPSTEEL